MSLIIKTFVKPGIAMQKNIKLLGILGALLSTIASAGSMGSQKPISPWFITASLGPAWADAGKTQTFYLASEIENTYVATYNRSTIVNGGLFVGFQQNITNTLFGQLGLAVAAAGNVNFSGDIWNDADPDFNNFTYNYKGDFTRIAVKSKVFYEWTQLMQPYLGASLGVGINRAHKFSMTPRIPEAVIAPSFTANTIGDAFAYSVEIGLQRVITTHWKGGLGYEFADWGKSALARAPGQTHNSGLEVPHLYTNGLQFNLTYLA